MEVNPITAQPATASVGFLEVYARLGTVYRTLLPGAGAGAILPGNIHDFAPKALAPNWDAGAVLFSYPTVGEWVSIQGIGSTADWTELPTHLSNLQHHTMSISTALLTDPPGVEPAIAAGRTGQWVDPLVGAITANTSLDGGVVSIIPVRYVISTVEFDKKEYFGLVLQSLVQLRRWYPRG